MTTHYLVEITYGNEAPLYSSLIYSRPLLADALEAAFRDSTYYAARYPLVRVQIKELCALCNGDGVMIKPRGFGSTKCKGCKGKGKAGWETTFDAMPHDNVEIIDRIEAVPA